MNYANLCQRFENKAMKERIKFEAELETAGMSAEVIKQAGQARYESTWAILEQSLDRGLTMGARPNGIKDILAKHGFGMNIKAKETKIDGKWWFITFKPSPDHKDRFSDFMTVCMTYLRRDFIKQWTACFEQNGENENELGKGYHIHILCEINIGFATLKRNTTSTWHKFFKDDVPNAFHDYVEIKTIEQAHVRLSYMNGHKKEEYKQAAIPFNAIWRKKHCLKDIYESDNLRMPSLPRPGAQAPINHM